MKHTYCVCVCLWGLWFLRTGFECDCVVIMECSGFLSGKERNNRIPVGWPDFYTAPLASFSDIRMHKSGRRKLWNPWLFFSKAGVCHAVQLTPFKTSPLWKEISPLHPWVIYTNVYKQNFLENNLPLVSTAGVLSQINFFSLKKARWLDSSSDPNCSKGPRMFFFLLKALV